ncbi:MAG: Hcp family type VI secretion system effector [Gemmatimonadota bacterium]
MSNGTRTGRTRFNSRRPAGVACAVALAAGIFLSAPGLAQEKMGRVKVKMPSLAATRGFIKIGGIDGESNDKDHDKWIDVMSVDWDSGAAQPAGLGRAGQVVIVKPVDGTSARIVEQIRGGSRIPVIDLHAPAGPDDPGETAYLKYKLKNVRIVSYSISGAADVPMEEITLQYEAIERNDGPVLKGKKILEN